MLPSSFHMYEYNNTPSTRLSSSLRPLLVPQLACTLADRYAVSKILKRGAGSVIIFIDMK